MNPELNEAVNALLEATWEHDPVGATHAGIHRYDQLLPDNSPEAHQEWGQTLRTLRGRFEALDAQALSRDERLDRRWALAVIDRALLENELREWERSPRYYLHGLGAGLHDLLIGRYAPVEERLAALLSRLRAIPAFLEVARRNLKPEAIPPIWLEYSLLTAKSTQQFLANAVPDAAARVPALAEEVALASWAAAQAVSDFAEHVREHGSAANGDFAIGRERFDFLLTEYHLLEMDSRQLYEFGREWIDRYEREMEAVARQIDPELGWVEVLERIKDDHPSAEQLRKAYEDETMLARRHCLEHDLITFPADESCSVEWMPEFLRASSPIAKPWVAPPFDPGLHSKWYITPVDQNAPPERQRQHLRDNSWAWIRGIAQHEMYPGHHLQLVIAKLVGTPLRRQFWSPIYGEGWGLYTEELFYETGLLAPPPFRLMQLRNGLWRAVRIVVDVGLHARGMPVEEAARLLAERARLEPRWAESETRLYTTRPTYPSSYQVGLALLLDLREEYKHRKGSAFQLKEFHDRLMRYSTLPINLLREEMLMADD